MDDLILLSAVVLFAGMFLPLPAPLGLALVLWALSEGVPLPLVCGLYLLQDILSFLAIRQLLPALGRRFPAQLAMLHARIPRRLRALLNPAAHAHRGAGAGLFSAALISFYAGAALAAVQRGAALKSAALVIAADLIKWVNGLAIALGAAHTLPDSPWTPLAASLLGLSAAALLQIVMRRREAVQRALAPAQPAGSRLLA